MNNCNFKNIYLYGNLFNLGGEKGEKILIYSKIDGKSNMMVRSLEGIFFSNKELEKSKSPSFTISREEMKSFANKYSGKFVEF